MYFSFFSYVSLLLCLCGEGERLEAGATDSLYKKKQILLQYNVVYGYDIWALFLLVCFMHFGVHFFFPPFFVLFLFALLFFFAFFFSWFKTFFLFCSSFFCFFFAFFFSWGENGRYPTRADRENTVGSTSRRMETIFSTSPGI